MDEVGRGRSRLVNQQERSIFLHIRVTASTRPLPTQAFPLKVNPDSNKIGAIGKLVVEGFKISHYHKGPQLVSTLPGVVSRNLSFLSPV